MRKALKRCSLCHTLKSRSQFGKRSSKKDGLCNYCQECSRERDNARAQLRRLEREKIDPKYAAWRERKRNRKIPSAGTPAREALYAKLLAQQDGKCAICRGATTGNNRCSRLDVDHDHVTGNVRGLLCNNCNQGLGRFKDDIMRLQSAIIYLADFEERGRVRSTVRDRFGYVHEGVANRELEKLRADDPEAKFTYTEND
jgi:hypothetical protein